MLETQNPQSLDLCQEQIKKPYETPFLIVHGTVAEITQNVGGANSDGPAGSVAFCSAPSDRNIKQNFEAVNGQSILGKIVAMPVTAWSYKTDGASVRHIGPMAQDFAAAFSVGHSDKHIHMVDANGVTMAAIQALYAMIQERDQQIDGLSQELDQLKQRLLN